MNGTIGEVRIFAGNFAPRNWAFCEGQLIAISSNEALFSIVGTIYGGDGRTTFGLPDLRGRRPVNPGAAPGGSNWREGQQAGLEHDTINILSMPSHTHTASKAALKASEGTNRVASPVGNYIPETGGQIYTDATPNVNMAANSITVTVGNSGGNQSHENRSPYLAMYYIICLLGVYPSRS